MVVKTISRDELKQKIDPKDNFPPVETLTAEIYHHQISRSAIDLPLERMMALATTVLYSTRALRAFDAHPQYLNSREKP